MARNAEATVQAAVVQYVRQVAPDVLIFSVPNGGLRTKREASLLRWTGVVAGIPDLILLHEGKAAFWEVKTAKGSLSKDQGLVASWLSVNDFDWWLIRSIDDAKQALAELGIKTREAAS